LQRWNALLPTQETMTAIVQVEFRPSILSIREDILESLGHPVVSVLGLQAARNLDLSDCLVGVIVIGHGTSWQDRRDLIAHFRGTLSSVPILALLRRQEEAFGGADFSCPADDPPQGIRIVRQALAGIQ
jgi:hypothetical protein